MFLSEGSRRDQSLRGTWGALAYLGLTVAGGLIVGLVTGTALTRLLRTAPATTPAVPASP